MHNHIVCAQRSLLLFVALLLQACVFNNALGQLCALTNQVQVADHTNMSPFPDSFGLTSFFNTGKLFPSSNVSWVFAHDDISGPGYGFSFKHEASSARSVSRIYSPGGPGGSLSYATSPNIRLSVRTLFDWCILHIELLLFFIFVYLLSSR